MQSQIVDKPIRVGVFGDVRQADLAVRRLLQAGFTKERISVVCSDEYKERYFSEFEHQEPAGSYTRIAVATGSAVGAALGALAAFGASSLLAHISLLMAGLILIPAGAVIGGFVGAMMTQGVEKELAHYYDQSVAD